MGCQASNEGSWCPTQVNLTGHFKHGIHSWNFCGDFCSISDGQRAPINDGNLGKYGQILSLKIIILGCSIDIDEPCLLPFIDASSGKTYNGCAQTPFIRTDTWCPTSLGDDGVFRMEENWYIRCLPEMCGISPGELITPFPHELEYLHNIYLDYAETQETLHKISQNGGRARNLVTLPPFSISH